jgi:type IV secretory pathway ATPase VirB11/archaellum biosynthesis ATPase
MAGFGSISCRAVLRTLAAASPPPTQNASCALSRIMSASRSMLVHPVSRPNCPERGSGLKALCRQWSRAPCFAIRRPAIAVFTFGDYVEAGIMSGQQAELLRAGVRDRKNILVAGGTSTGKTTLVNALLAEVANR